MERLDHRVASGEDETISPKSAKSISSSKCQVFPTCALFFNFCMLMLYSPVEETKMSISSTTISMTTAWTLSKHSCCLAFPKNALYFLIFMCDVAWHYPLRKQRCLRLDGHNSHQGHIRKRTHEHQKPRKAEAQSLPYQHRKGYTRQTTHEQQNHGHALPNKRHIGGVRAALLERVTPTVERTGSRWVTIGNDTSTRIM